MAGPNPPKQPSSSTSNHRKSRWESSSSAPNKSASSTATDPKSSTKPNPSPKTGPSPSSAAHNKSQANPSPAHPPYPPVPPFPPFPDPAALGLPPPPAYGFHMLERRTIVLYDGSVRSYFALPPDYQDFPTRPVLGPPDFGSPPLGFRDNPDYRNGSGEGPGPLKRKYGEGEKDPREEKQEELARQRPGHPNARVYSLGAGTGTSSPFRNEETRAAKYMRVGGPLNNSNLGFSNKHLDVDQNALKKAFLHFVKMVFENAALKKSYLEDGKQGRLHCVACTRFDD